MEQTQITYHEENGYLYPDLALPEQKHYPIGKYGDLHLAFLKEHRKATYATLLTSGKLNEYLHGIDIEARRMVGQITAGLAKTRGIDEKLKAIDPMRWGQEMNNCKASAEETVYKKILYR